MINKRSAWTGIFAGSAMVLLVLDSKTAFRGAYDGIMLCITSVIPSLFPFMVLSGIITNAFRGKAVRLLKYPGRLCRIPPGSESLLLTGFLGGYPTGAQCVYSEYRHGCLSQEEARRMLGFCSNAGPAFIFGITSGLFQRKYIPYVLWGIHIISALMVGAILPGKTVSRYSRGQAKQQSVSSIVSGSVAAMGSVCGWIIIFRLVIAFFQHWFLWLLPEEGAVLAQGILELTNGCLALTDIASEPLRFIICSILLAFGGLCVWLQTLSVTGELKGGRYLFGKILQAGISCVLSILLSGLLF